MNAPAARAPGDVALRARTLRHVDLRASATAAIDDLDVEAARGAVHLPPGHPPWVTDARSITRRARAALAALPQVIVRVIRAWEHPRREAMVQGRLVAIDAAGTYRVSL